MDAPSSTAGGRSALVLGATGLVGGHCLDLLLADPAYARVVVVVRRPLGRADPKIEERVVDFDRLRDQPELFAVDDVYSCLGTTIRKAGSREAFWRVDVEYPAVAAELAALAGARRYLLVSALGADSKSRIPYNRAKGVVEARVRAQPIPEVWVFRPSLLLGEREELRVGERIAEFLLRPISPLLVGPLRRYRPVHARQVAAAMYAAAHGTGRGGTIESESIPELARSVPLPPADASTRGR